MNIQAEVPEVISLSWIVERLHDIPCNYWDSLNGVIVKRISEDEVDFPAHEYYAGDYIREERTIILYVPLWNDRYGCFMGSDKQAWGLEKTRQFIDHWFPHELAHHINLDIIGYKDLVPEDTDEYEIFYEEEEERARKLQGLIRLRQWENIDGVIETGQKKVQKTLARS